MPDTNTVQQINQWYRNEPLTAGHLNQMVNAINFLLKTTGYLLNRTALANYSSANSSANYPGIIEKVTIKTDATDPAISYGNLILPPLSGINGVVWDDSITQPEIIDNILHLNPADYAPDLEAADASYLSSPGFISGVKTSDPSSAPTANFLPRIEKGTLILPRTTLTIENVSGQLATSASPGSDGWVQTFFIRGVYQNGSVQFEKWDRQLMRFSDTTLQVVRQTSYDSGATWSDASI